MGSTLTTYDALLKERYLDTNKVVEKLVFPENVLLAKLEKSLDRGMVGDTLPVPFFTGLPQGVGGVFSTVQTKAGTTPGNTVSHKWQITMGDYFGVVHIGDKVLEASRTNAGAFLENKTIEIDTMLEQAGEDLSIYTWGNGGQALGQIASISSNELTLVDPATVGNFEVGMSVVASAADGSTSTDSLRDSGDASVLTNKNTSEGKITITVADIAGLAAGDYLFRQADFFGDQGVIVIRGVEAFITPTDSPPALWGVTANQRATDPHRTAGYRVAANIIAGKPMDERIRLLIAQMTTRGKAKMPTAGFLHPEDFEVLTTLMEARGIRTLTDDSTNFGFEKINIKTGQGTLPIFTDRHCRRGTFFALRLEDWGLASMGDLIHPQKGDGLTMLRRASSTDYEFRAISYPGLWCRAPKNSGRVLTGTV